MGMRLSTNDRYEERVVLYGRFDCSGGSLQNTIVVVGDMTTPNLLMTGLSERACEPLQTFVETISGRSASRLDVLQGC